MFVLFCFFTDGGITCWAGPVAAALAGGGVYKTNDQSQNEGDLTSLLPRKAGGLCANGAPVFKAPCLNSSRIGYHLVLEGRKVIGQTEITRDDPFVPEVNGLFFVLSQRLREPSPLSKLQ